MHGLSTILSLIIKLLSKLFKVFGINSILILVLVLEIFICVGYASETKDDDRRTKEFEYTGAEITEIACDDPVIKEQDIYVNKDDHYYLVELKIKNNYSDPLSYLTIDAKNGKGSDLSCYRIRYYGNDMNEYPIQNYIPEGTEGTFTYLLIVDDYQYDETNEVKIYEFSGDKKQFISVTIPK
nr:hypothetical protein [Lachnospiraceae bacterium]MBQ8253817.1 hypothetical protein [Lachnospiraceae bacterium]